jgi:hypothetical protein
MGLPILSLHLTAVLSAKRWAQKAYSVLAQMRAAEKIVLKTIQTKLVGTTGWGATLISGTNNIQTCDYWATILRLFHGVRGRHLALNLLEYNFREAQATQ